MHNDRSVAGQVGTDHVVWACTAKIGRPPSAIRIGGRDFYGREDGEHVVLSDLLACLLTRADGIEMTRIPGDDYTLFSNDQ